MNTIKSHVASAISKLGVANRTAMVALLMLDQRFRDLYAAPGKIVGPGACCGLSGRWLGSTGVLSESG